MSKNQRYRRALACSVIMVVVWALVVRVTHLGGAVAYLGVVVIGIAAFTWWARGEAKKAPRL